MDFTGYQKKKKPKQITKNKVVDLQAVRVSSSTNNEW